MPHYSERVVMCSFFVEDDKVMKKDRHEGEAAFLENDDFDQDLLNPDIYRPSPPRTGASRLFENPFDLTDEDSAPVNVPNKLSPSHVFESTSLEQVLIEAAEMASQTSSYSAPSMRPLDSRTFVIKRSSKSSSKASSKTSSKASSPSSEDVTNISDLPEFNTNVTAQDDLELGAEANEVPEDEVGMDYDNLMAYFESLKESTA